MNPIHLIAGTHIDPVWLWRWQEGCNEVLQSFRSALDRLRETPGLVYTCSSAAYYRWVEEIDPAMFEEIKQAVKAGRWCLAGGWWVEPDCNIPSGESYARHALYGQLYYQEKFGVTCKTGYNTDSFGHNAMLPQLLRQGGMNGCAMFRPDLSENAGIPENAFWWKSPDGSRVLVYRQPHGNSGSGREKLDRAVNFFRHRAEQAGHGMMLFFGIGNHGGGPTKDDLAFLTDKMRQEGFEGLKFSSPDQYFEDLRAQKLELPVWKDEMQHHASGCYSAQSGSKQFNRRAEQALYFAEAFDAAAALQFGTPPASAKIKMAWQDVAFNQFHDIVGGCSIAEAYEDMRDQMGHACTIADRAANKALLQFSRRIDTWVEGCSEPTEEIRHRGIPRHLPRPIVVFNALNFDREIPVTAILDADYVEDADRNPVPTQIIVASRHIFDDRGDTRFLAKVPAMGYALFWMTRERANPPAFPDTGVRGGETGAGVLYIENGNLRVEFCPKTGGIKKLIDKKTYCALNSETMAIPTVIGDSKGLMRLEHIRLLECGPVMAQVQVKHSFESAKGHRRVSTLLQKYSLSAKQNKIVVEAKALWFEPHTLLKLPLPLAGTDATSTYEIPGGFIKRLCDGEEEPGLGWADLTVTDKNGKRRGVSVMSDSKYSYDCPGNELRLTAIRNAIYADGCAQRPDREFDFTDEGLQRFTWAIYPHEGEAEQSDVTREAACLNNPAVVLAESYHPGGLPPRMSLVRIDRANILMTAYKLCEDGSGDLIVRCYETQGKDTCAQISLPQTNAAFEANFGKHEIKTLRIGRDGNVRQVNYLEGVA